MDRNMCKFECNKCSYFMSNKILLFMQFYNMVTWNNDKWSFVMAECMCDCVLVLHDVAAVSFITPSNEILTN